MGKCRRHSPKREAILDCLRSTDCHPAAEWVHAQLKPEIPNLSLATVYRNLAQFRREGVIRTIGTVDGEERYDGNMIPHSHFICTGCGKITDVPYQEVSTEDIGDVGKVERCSVTFYGRCSECLKKAEEDSTEPVR